MLVIVVVMILILALAGLVVAYVAYPHRGEELPAPRGSATRCARGRRGAAHRAGVRGRARARGRRAEALNHALIGWRHG